MAWLRIALALLLSLAAFSGQAQGLESALSPGPVIRGHAKWEDQCASCHVRFDRAGQDARCLDCHKDVAADLKNHTGWHGRQKPQPCRSCHTDHKGRDMQIAPLDRKAFDHRSTDWPLREAHARVNDCAKCHVAGQRWREAPQDCAACHRRDDVHKGQLGAKCADCHTETRWADTRFDHSTTRFALSGQHASAKCTACHRPGQPYTSAPDSCQGCHKDDDFRKGHKGRFGDRCDSCHDAKAWRPARFNHDADTDYALRGKHRAARCEACHTGPLYREKLQTACIACHRADDTHRGSLGTECATCHQESGWKSVGKFDHDKSRFPLLGRHAEATCKACHRSAAYREVPSTCIGCHRADDRHQATLGESCGSCHGERTWKIPRFDHSLTRYPLRGGHLKAACTACHADATHYRDTPSTCLACHRRDDKHEGQLGERCETCHQEQSWRSTRFDHARARFPLVGAHLAVECRACHRNARYRDAPRECAGCHRQDDTHRGALGQRCDSCHNARAWPLVRFDHERDGRWRLDGAHGKVRCQACHNAPAPAGRAIAEVGRECVACHRRDDPHDGAFGARCDTCHTTLDWKSLRARRPSAPATPGDRP
ncbi:cytochrome c3 family protein [Ideonella sp. DXS29W]|uniref:Cytochrome c3 family protein n=1 Tax=Ideonella lacteola TaxID=2984193 RepID=A0ABU9BJR3_9BURK